MREWAKARLEDCCRSISDGDHLPPPKTDSGIPFVTISDIHNNRFDLSNTRFVPEAYYEAIDQKRKIQKGDVLYSVVGSYGIPVFADESLKVAFQRHIAILRPSEEIEPRFLYYSMLNRDFFLKADAVAVGAAQKTITLAALRGLEIALPPLPIQRRIAAILSDYDSAIDNARWQIALLEEAAMRLYREWFVVNADPKWEKRRLWDVCDYFRGVSYTSKEIAGKGGVPLITLKNIERFGGFREDRSKTFSGVCKDGSSAGPNDVLMAVTDMTKERRLVGHVAMVPDTYDKAQFSMDLIRLKGKLVSNSFLYAMLRYSTYADEFAVRASGANVLHLKPSSLDDCEVVVPKRGLREKFDFVFVPMTQKKNALYRTILRLTEARDRLLPKLMSGEIEV